MATINEDSVSARYIKTIPTTYNALLSDNSDARTCFVRQKFSKKLQTFLVDYSLKVNGPLAHTIGTR